jgi:H+/Cl- antiporter ClcA
MFEGLRLKNVTYFIVILNILRTIGKFYDHLVNFVLIWYNFSGFGITYQQKSGNPVLTLPHNVFMSMYMLLM